MPQKTYERPYLTKYSLPVRLVLLTGLVLLLCTPAFCQETPPVNLSAGYTLLRDNTVGTNADGWFAAVSGNFNRWFGLTGEIGGSAAAHNAFGTITNFGARSLFGGPSLTTNFGRHVSPFAHFLIGAVRSDISATGFAAHDYDYAIQPGVGLNWWLRPGIGIRLGGDYRRIPSQEYSGSSGFRFQVGIVAEITE